MLNLICTDLWGDIQNRRKVFESHANQFNLDHQNPDNWYRLINGIKYNKVYFTLYIVILIHACVECLHYNKALL